MLRLPSELILEITNWLAIDDVINILDVTDKIPHWLHVYHLLSGSKRRVKGPKRLRHLTNVDYVVTTPNDDNITYGGIVHLELNSPDMLLVTFPDKVISACMLKDLSGVASFVNLRRVELRGCRDVDLTSLHGLEQATVRYTTGQLDLPDSVVDVSIMSCVVSVTLPCRIRTLKCVEVEFVHFESKVEGILDHVTWKATNLPLSVVGAVDDVNCDQPPAQGVRYGKFRYSPPSGVGKAEHIYLDNWNTPELVVYDVAFSSISLGRELVLLSLNGCLLSTIPFNLPSSLRHLSVRNNNLHQVKVNCQLQSLDVSMNDITTLEGLPQSLEVLVAAFNCLCHVPITHIPPLVHTLDLTDNLLERFEVPQHVHRVNLHGNPLTWLRSWRGCRVETLVSLPPATHDIIEVI